MKFEYLLARNVRGFWVTSYSFGLKLFDQYLLRKLSQQTLNAVVLVDHDKLADVWEHLPPNERYLAHRAGSRYLLRGLRSPGGGAFHPKTYLFVRSNEALLVVGSGNLTRDGIDRGREVFTSFTSAREQDLPSMRAWATWISRLVRSEDDELLRERWSALRQACPWMLGSPEGSAFLVNDEQTLLAQLVERVPDSVEELHVTAPFFDREAQALAALIAEVDPARVVLYVGAGVKVDGDALTKVLGNARDVTAYGYAPRTFVHAKLIGAVGRDGDSILLSGSPNLSGAALTRSSRDRFGNVEAAVVRRGAPEQVRALFVPRGLELVERSISSLGDLEFEDDHPTMARPLILRTATWRTDGRIAVSCNAEPPVGTTLRWDEQTAGVVVRDCVTVDELVELEPLICWLAGADGETISNRVALDDPAALREALSVSDRRGGKRPSELEGLELVPLVQLAFWAHDKLILDVDDTHAIQAANDAAGEDQSAEDAGEFWALYAREEFQNDVRSHTYRPLSASAGAGPVDELMRELQMLLNAAPDAPHPVLRALTASGKGGSEDDDDVPRAGTPWTMEARQRIRAYHLLTRWCDAVADPRHSLIADDAPAINYQTLLGVLVLAWIHDALDQTQLRRLLFKLLSAFIGQTPGQGFLGRIDEPQREAALERIDPFMVEVAAALVAVALAPRTGWRLEIYDWQPLLGRGIEFGVILPGEWSAVVFARITEEQTDSDQVDQLLSSRLEYLDDKTWAQRLAAELDLRRVTLDLSRNATVRAWVEVDGPTDPLHDVRLLTVARRAIDFKHLPAIAISCGEACRMIFEPGKQARGMIAGVWRLSSTPVDAARIRQIEQQGGSWADVLDARRAA